MSLSCRKKKFLEGVHPKALLRTKQVRFDEEVVVKEFVKEAHPSALFGTRLIATDDSDNGTGTESSSEISSFDITSSLDDFDSEDILSDDEDQGYISTEEETFEEESREMKMSMFDSMKVKFNFKQEKRRKKMKMKLKSCQRRRVVLLVGDMACGKSSLVTTYCKDRFTEVYTPTILHCCESDAKISGTLIKLELVDVPGRYDYKPIRCTKYKNIDVAVLCYSAGDIESLEHIKTHWLPELKECAPKCPFVLAETKKDIRDEHEDIKLTLENGEADSKEFNIASREILTERIVPPDAGCKLAKEIGAHGFYSCSAKYRIGTRSLLQGATLVALKKSRKKRTCL